MKNKIDSTIMKNYAYKTVKLFMAKCKEPKELTLEQRKKLYKTFDLEFKE